MNTNFSNPEGRELARKLAEYLVNNEEFQNIDECLDEIRQEVNTILNKRTGAEVSLFLDAELVEHIKLGYIQPNRYKVKITDKLQNDFLHQRITNNKFMEYIQG